MGTVVDQVPRRCLIISPRTAPLAIDGGGMDRSCTPGIDAIVVNRSVDEPLQRAPWWSPPVSTLVVLPRGDGQSPGEALERTAQRHRVELATAVGATL